MAEEKPPTKRQVGKRNRLLNETVDALALKTELLLEEPPLPMGGSEATRLVAKLEGSRKDINTLIKRHHKPTRRPSRSARWAEAASTAIDALTELLEQNQFNPDHSRRQRNS